MKGRITGVILKRAFTGAVLAKLQDHLDRVPADAFYAFQEGEGKSYPKSFSNISNIPADEVDLYLQDQVRRVEGFYRLFSGKGFNFFDALKMRLSSLGSREFTSPVVKDNGTEKAVNFGSFRILFPEKGGIKLHVGDYFKHLYHPFYKKFGIAPGATQLSYFLVVKKPEQGGFLEVFDVTFEKYGQIVPPDKVQNKDGKVRSISKFRKVSPHLEEGDMIVFNGGKFWHRVTEPVGASQRISFGGFLSEKDSSGFLIWA